MPSEQGPEKEAAPRSKRPGRWLERAIGIFLGIVLGVGVIALFVFESSEDTIDAARISGLEEGGQQQGAGSGAPVQVPLVRVIDGKPPAGGPVQLDFEQGTRARFVIGSNAPVEIEVSDLGVTRGAGAGRTLVSFDLPRPGQFPVLAADSKIELATLRVAGR